MKLTNTDITTLTKALNNRIGYLIDTDINTETPTEYCKNEIKKCIDLIRRLETEPTNN